MKSAPKLSKPLTILLVDDNLRQRNERCLILSTHGYDVSFSDSRDALPACDGVRPDLVVLALAHASHECLQSMELAVRANPCQRIGFVISGSVSLSPLFYEGAMLRSAEDADDFVARIAMLLAGSRIRMAVTKQ